MERMLAALELVSADERFAYIHHESGVGTSIGLEEILSQGIFQDKERLSR
jgi:hypothetical protein